MFLSSASVICRRYATTYLLRQKFGASKCQHHFFGGRLKRTENAEKSGVLNAKHNLRIKHVKREIYPYFYC